MPKSLHSPRLEKIALELGYISIYWAWIEDVIDELVTTLAPLQEGHVADAITGNADMKQKIQMVKALAFLKRKEHPGWYDSVVGNLNTIDNDLRTRRNSYIHSMWKVPRGRLTRQKKIVRISKPQAFKEPELATRELKPIKIKETRQLCQDLIAATKLAVCQLAFAMDFEWWSSRDIPFEQSHLWTKPLVRRKRSPTKPSPPHQSLRL
ncbi:hypothetical protein [Afipia sp. 1NLS2]|uniref:hypothetical protein n=1 Tax=Afipia sp. 1NLS2 TaxID=666684 RepID=UPI0001DA078F|nr:hypothetical protein [Afipia sp. 1NLS2]EFI52017.1 hypothetical protein AfiDRAFT_0003 [Afipia sp. 1NLS2]